MGPLNKASTSSSSEQRCEAVRADFFLVVAWGMPFFYEKTATIVGPEISINDPVVGMGSQMKPVSINLKDLERWRFRRRSTKASH